MEDDQCNNQKSAQKVAPVMVIMVPFPAQGHLNQLLHLSRLISSYNIPVHFVGTAIHCRQAKLRVHGWDPLSIANIHFNEFPTPPLPSPPPKPNNSLVFPSHFNSLFDTPSLLRHAFTELLFVLSPTAERTVVIHDTSMAPTVQDIVSVPHAEAYSFQALSAFFYLSYLPDTIKHEFGIEMEFTKHVPPLETCLSSEVLEFGKTLMAHQKFNSGDLYNSSYVIEGEFLDILNKVKTSHGIKQWAIGPFNPVVVVSGNSGHECLKWLDKQAPDSVLFVSFGTSTTLSDEQIVELAMGLEESGQKFIWVLRDADRVDIFVGDARRAELPQGYEERIQGKGMIVRDWAPQLDILAHRSTGGFMSHCGWNSCFESMTMGVPIAAWPMHSDQPANAVLVTKVLKIGVVARDWVHEGEVVKSSTIEEVVRGLMESEEGEKIRRRAAEIGAAIRSSVAEGGLVRADMDNFISHIRR